MSQFHFVGEDVTRLKALAEKAALNVAFKIQTANVAIKSHEDDIHELKRHTWFGLGWFNTAISNHLHEIDGIQWRQEGRKFVKLQLDELVAQLWLSPTSITLDETMARMVKYWSVGFDECSASS